ncbi:uncharacterized protein TNCT_434451 [Trichonephila clavata]|uniref:Uncharacterized protein n=1 Tax=Trichonephila clavata TaxID=2740835 RepID=A0A8X6G051_TRICU|nr:uncharacterized protein TNCT_434451 [Trichonephila clavata]
MIGQDKQKHNLGSIDEGYDTRTPTPTNFEDGAIDESEDEGTSDHNVPNKTSIDREGDDVIRIQDGKYHDIKGRFQMTFPISNSEKIVITLSSEKADKPENASSFGKIMVHMDDKSCEIFSKYLKELEKEPRISKVVEAAKSFVEEKNGKPK